MTQVNEMKRVYKHRYAFLIAIFGFTCMFAQFWFFETSVDNAKQLYQQFNSTYPEESRAFLWAFESEWRFLDNWPLVGLSSGITTFWLVFVLIALFAERVKRKEIIADFVIILVCLLVFLVFSYTFNPLVLHRSYNVAYAFVSSAICGVSSHLLLIHDHLKKKRRTQLPISSSRDTKRDLRLKSYELEHAEYRNILHSLLWITVFVSAGLIITGIFQFSFTMPLEMALSNTFGKSNSILTVVFLLGLFGLLVGVFFQLMYEMHDIVNLIREQTVELET